MAIFHDGENEIVSTAFAGVDVNKKGMDFSQAYGSSESYSLKRSLGNLFLLDDTKDSDSTNTHGKSLKDEFISLAKNSKDPKVLDAAKNVNKWNDSQLNGMIAKLKGK
jgi:hypothetical protein